MGISTVHSTSHRGGEGASPGEPLPWDGAGEDCRPRVVASSSPQVLLKTLSIAAGPLMWFMVTFFIVLIGCAQAFHIAFHLNVPEHVVLPSVRPRRARAHLTKAWSAAACHAGVAVASHSAFSNQIVCESC